MVTTAAKAKAQSPDAVTIGQLRALGFSDDIVETPYRLVASLSGREKTGKTHFALTAPEPIIFFNVDLGTEGVVSKFQAQGKQVFIYDVRVPKTAKQDIYVPMWADLKVRIAKAYELKKGTVIWDSVAGDSPLLLKDERGFVWVGTIEDFWAMVDDGRAMVTDRGEQVLRLSPDRGWTTLNTVWDSDTKERVNPWTPVKSVIRHYYRGPVLRITTAGGTIRVTPNHSLMQGSGASAGFVDAATLKVGDVLSLPMYVRTPTNLCRRNNGCAVFVGSLDLAWLYGFFVAEGSAWDVRDSRYPNWRGVHASFSNKDEALARRAREIVEGSFHVSVDVRCDKHGMWCALIQDSGVSAYLKTLFYNSRREKVVPPTILNAKPDVKRAFVQGYLAGDGHQNASGTWEFDTTSPSLAQAFVWMERSSGMGSRDVSVYTRPDKPSVVRATFPKRAVGPRGRIRSIVEEQYDGLVYDLETENHAFCAGVGGILAHNTATEIYELARLARFGKLTQVLPHNYAEVNNEWRELLRTAYDAPLNTVFVHKMKAVWINNARTGNYELSGFAEMDYLSQVNLLCYREDSSEGGGMPEFSVFVKDSRLNPSVNGTTLRGPMCDFEFLLSLVHGK